MTTTAGGTPQPASATAFPFALPKDVTPGQTQALAVGSTDGGVVYNVEYALVTVTGGAPVTQRNSAFAFAHCNKCTTVAVSFEVVLVVGQSNVIAPIDEAGALNVDCPACVTTALAEQLVFTLKAQPSTALRQQLDAALAKLDALPQLGAAGTPAQITAQVQAVQQQVETILTDSGLLSATAQQPSPSASPSAISSSIPSTSAIPISPSSTTVNSPTPLLASTSASPTATPSPTSSTLPSPTPSPTTSSTSVSASAPASASP